MAKMNWNDIPEAGFEIEETDYPMVIESATLITTSGGYKAIQLTWKHLNSPSFKINYDNCIFGTKDEDFNTDIPAVRFGLAKLKHINEATVSLPDLDTDVLVKVLPGQKALVSVKMGDKYPEVDGTNIKKLEIVTPTAPAQPESFDVADEDDPFKL